MPARLEAQVGPCPPIGIGVPCVHSYMWLSRWNTSSDALEKVAATDPAVAAPRAVAIGWASPSALT